MKPVGKPDAGNPHVRFDERGGETDRSRDTAPLLDSTADPDRLNAAPSPWVSREAFVPEDSVSQSMRRMSDVWWGLRSQRTRPKGGLHETFRRFQAGGLASQARLFGVGGLIQAAVGLAGGIGGLLTKRSGLSRNA